MKTKSYEIVPSNLENKRKREDWDNYFMNLATEIAKRSTCDRANVGCVIVNERHRVVAIGYNGSCGSQTSHCDDIGHTMRDSHCIATVHAEMNALCDCAFEGKSTKDCSIYVTHFPCLNCTKAIIQSGIKGVYYKNDYRVDDYAMDLFNNNNIILKKIE